MTQCSGKWRQTGPLRYERYERAVSWDDELRLFYMLYRGPGWLYERPEMPCLEGPFNTAEQAMRACDAECDSGFTLAEGF